MNRKEKEMSYGSGRVFILGGKRDVESERVCGVRYVAWYFCDHDSTDGENAVDKVVASGRKQATIVRARMLDDGSYQYDAQLFRTLDHIRNGCVCNR